MSLPAGMILSWNPTIAATGYEVWRNTSNNPNTATRIASHVPISLFYDLSPLAGTNYYWIKAVNPAGASSFSAGFSVTTPAISRLRSRWPRRISCGRTR